MRSLLSLKGLRRSRQKFRLRAAHQGCTMQIDARAGLGYMADPTELVEELRCCGIDAALVRPPPPKTIEAGVLPLPERHCVFVLLGHVAGTSVTHQS